LQNGKSNVKFNWFVSANRADEKIGNHTIKYQDVRFPLTELPDKAGIENKLRIEKEEENNTLIRAKELEQNLEIKRKAEEIRQKEKEEFEKEQRQLKMKQNQPY
ncbi:MAG: hypothetical protein NZ522_02365, partial [Chitinophagales bacterium]|nr:hypothetical protein [Chitinophagales bacterium]